MAIILAGNTWNILPYQGRFDSRSPAGIPVSTPNIAPTIIGAPTTLYFIAGVGGTFAFASYTDDVNGDVLTYSLQGAAYTGITINSSTGVLSVGTDAVAGTPVLTVRATDTGALYAEWSVTVTVQEVVATPARFTIPANTSARTFGVGTYPLSAGGVGTPVAGDVIELAAGTHGPLVLRGINGVTDETAITVRGPSSGQAIIRRADSINSGFVVNFSNCHYFVFDGESSVAPLGEDGKRHSIKIMYPTARSTPDQTSYIKFTQSGTSTLTVTDHCTMRYIEIDGGWTDGMSPTMAGIGMSTNDNGALKTVYPGEYVENVIIEHCCITAIPGEGMYMGPNYTTGSVPLRNFTVRHNYVARCGLEGIQGKSWFSGTNAIHGNICIDNLLHTSDNDASAQINVFIGQANVYDNFCYSSGGHGIVVNNFGGLLTSSNEPGIGTIAGFDSDIYNNVVVGTGKNAFFGTGKGISTGYNSGAGEVPINGFIYNNTVVDTSATGIQSSGSGWVRNNIIFNYTGSATGGSATNNLSGVVTLSDYFVSPNTTTPESGNWHLLAEQAAVGTPGTDISSTDIAGTSRSGTASKGAYEYT